MPGIDNGMEKVYPLEWDNTVPNHSREHFQYSYQNNSNFRNLFQEYNGKMYREMFIATLFAVAKQN